MNIEKNKHHSAIGELYIISSQYKDKFKKGGNQKLQKLLGENIYKQIGKNWYYNNWIICKVMTTEELQELTNLIKSNI